MTRALQVNHRRKDREVSLEIRGSGSVTLAASRSLDVDIAGSGDLVEY